MKQFAVVAGLAATLAAGNVHFPNNHGHGHAHARRDYGNGPFTSWTTTVAWETVTITKYGNAESTQPGGGQQQNAYVAQGPPAGAAVSAPASAPASVPAPAQPQVQAPAPQVQAAAVQPSTAVAPSTPVDVNAAQAAANAAQESVNAAQKSADFAYQDGMISKQGNPGGAAPYVATLNPSSQAYPTQTQPVVAPSSSVASPPAQSGGGSPGGSTGGPLSYSASATYYPTSNDPGYCELGTSDMGHTIAISESILAAAGGGGRGTSNPLCGQKVTFVVKGTSYSAEVRDKCAACSADPKGLFDIPQGWAAEIYPDMIASGHVPIDSWSFDDPAKGQMYASYIK